MENASAQAIIRKKTRTPVTSRINPLKDINTIDTTEMIDEMSVFVVAASPSGAI